MSTRIKLIGIMCCVLGLACSIQAAVIINDDFSNAAVSEANWLETTYGAASAASYVQYDTAGRPDEMVIYAASTNTSLAEIEATDKNGISMENAMAGDITQVLTLGSYPSDSGAGELWLIGSDGSSGFDRNCVEGGYIRLVFNYSNNTVNVYARGKGDTMSTLLSKSVTDLAEDDVFTVTYDTTNVASLTFYDASTGTTSDLISPSSPIAHGLDFSTDYANGAYTAISLYTYAGSIATFKSIVVTGVPEPATLALLGVGSVLFVRRKK